MTTLIDSSCRKLRKDGALVEILLDCHADTRRHIDLAVGIGERVDIGGADIANAAARVERYFAEVFPLHIEDEEASILPLLRGRSSRIDSALVRMQEQHDVYDGMIERICVQANVLQGRPDDHAGRYALASVARPLRLFLTAHLQAEEEVIFPEIRTYLSREEERLVRREMENRRRIG
jgi:iron-sulfur cluster repair protein YtfE (RIC family)